MNIIDLATLDSTQRGEAARILRQALAHMPSAYNGPSEAEAEVAEAIDSAERLGLAAVQDGVVVGWIGAIRTYTHGWELHPLVVDPAFQGRGIGSALSAALETAARAQGVLTLYLGADDDFGGTNLFGQALFPQALEKLAGIEARQGHPFTFYRRLGYEVVGVVPDVNGPGRPDILMAKPLR